MAWLVPLLLDEHLNLKFAPLNAPTERRKVWLSLSNQGELGSLPLHLRPRESGDDSHVWRSERAGLAAEDANVVSLLAL